MPFIKLELRKTYSEGFFDEGHEEELSSKFELIVNLNEIRRISLDYEGKPRVIIKQLGECRIENYSFGDLEAELVPKRPFDLMDI